MLQSGWPVYDNSGFMPLHLVVTVTASASTGIRRMVKYTQLHLVHIIHFHLTRLACWMTASMSPAPSACGALLPASCGAAAASSAPLPAGAAAAEARMLEAVVGAPFADSMLAVPPGYTHRGELELQVEHVDPGG
jgi:hypothetical protein